MNTAIICNLAGCSWQPTPQNGRMQFTSAGNIIGASPALGLFLLPPGWVLWEAYWSTGLRIEQYRFESWLRILCGILGQDTSLSHRVFPPMCIDGEGQIKCWGNLYDGVASHPGGTRNAASRFLLQSSGLSAYFAPIQPISAYLDGILVHCWAIISISWYLFVHAWERHCRSFM